VTLMSPSSIPVEEPSGLSAFAFMRENSGCIPGASTTIEITRQYLVEVIWRIQPKASGAMTRGELVAQLLFDGREAFRGLFRSLTHGRNQPIMTMQFGGVLVSTMRIRRRRHAEDGSLASLKIEPKNKS
jgi:hypothetical protein